MARHFPAANDVERCCERDRRGLENEAAQWPLVCGRSFGHTMFVTALRQEVSQDSIPLAVRIFIARSCAVVFAMAV